MHVRGWVITTLLSVLFAAGGARAHEPAGSTGAPPKQLSREQVAKLQKEAEERRKTPVPKDCPGQCDFVTDSCARPCKEMKARAEVKQSCAARCEEMKRVCKQGCSERGGLDTSYMIEHLNVPDVDRGTPKEKP